MMYEPPNRGGKTYQTLNNTPTGTNDPAALTDATDAGRLVPVDPRLYDGVVAAGKTISRADGAPLTGPFPATGPVATASFPIVHGPGNSTITGPGYEYIVTGAATLHAGLPGRLGQPEHRTPS